MNHPNIFEYKSYRQYIKDCLELKGLKSGLKKRASEFLSVHTTFISQVTLGKADFSLDQSEKINQFLKHTDEEGEYFLELVIFERASDPKLRERYELKINNKIAEQTQISKRLIKRTEISDDDQDKFYTSYIYGLLHVLSSIPAFQTREKLIHEVGYSPKVVHQAIDFLLKIGILKQSNEKIICGEQHVHLTNESKNIWKHHANWRLATLSQFNFREKSDLHYSLVFSCSEKDVVRMKEDLLIHLKNMNERISKSKEEVACVYNFDFYKWK
ncbi:MAG: TIGR02147 family protein [Moraxellaceae bacterium]|nr:TIGR02147 family protein [Pseudobdellovibrionaceae bacterium]